MADIQGQISEEQARLDDILKQQRDALQANNGIQLEAEGLNASVERLTKDVTDKQTELDALKNDLDSVSVARSQKQEELNTLTAQLGAAKADLDAALTAVNVANASKDQIASDAQTKAAGIIADATAKVAEISARKDEVERSIAPLSEQVGRFNEQITSLQTDIATATQSLADINTQVTTLTATRDSLDADIAARQTQIDTLTAAIADKTTQAAALDQSIAGKKTESDKAQADLDAVKIELQTNNEQNADFLKLKAGLMAGIELNNERTEFLKQKYGDLGETFN